MFFNRVRKGNELRKRRHFFTDILENKMRKRRIYIRVLCVLQKVKMDIQFFFFC